MNREIEAAEQRLVRLQIASQQIQKEIRALRQTRDSLQKSIKTHIALYENIQQLLEESINEIERL